MRISDWSSDVCSSDLHVDLSPVAGTPAADGCHKSDLAHRIDTRRATPGIQLLEAGDAPEDRTPEGHDRPLLEGRQDRKGCVWGKSVADRCNPCDRRFLKKKKQMRRRARML